MGQDSEQAAEFVATVRGEHVEMKTWYNSSETAEAKALHEKYGPYPALWKEVLNWAGWKDARREYLKQKQQGEADNSSAVPRKRKSRWGSSNEASGDAEAAKRRSRWGSNDAQPQPAAPPIAPPAIPAPGPPLVLPGMAMAANLPPEKQEEMKHLQARLREINDKIENLDREAARVDSLPRGHRERSPSPPPIYGPDGKRKNTRAVRWRERYTAERQDILEKIMNLNPNPHARKTMSHLLVRKRVKKIPIPIDRHPNYNFIGLIIGPRGKTQKELESKTGCKIAIRGKGSVKEGARGRRDGKVMEGDNEPLHVVITGDDQKAVDAAAYMMEQMLIVIDDEKNVHKQQQLRELALLNGTLKEDEFCQICAEKGHRSFECPRRFAQNNNRPVVKCAICGDTSHPTRDCTQKQGPDDNQKNQQEIDSEYQSFMAELDGKKTEAPAFEPRSGVAASAGVTPGPQPPIQLPPPPSTSMPPPPVSLPPVSLLPVMPQGGGHLPPPPPPPAMAPMPPPHAPGGYYGGHQQYSPPPHEAYGGHHEGYGNHYQQQPPQHYGQAMQPQHQQQHPQQQQQQQQPPRQHQVRPGEETTEWDPSSYYGYGNQGGGAGGFNWWEN